MAGSGIEGSIGSLAIFIIINSITPGPNNLMLLQGGLKRGLWECRWHMFGISFGVGIMLWLSYWGMAIFIVSYPALMLSIRLLGTAYLLWLAYHIAKTNFADTIHRALLSKKSRMTSIDTKQHFGVLPLRFWEAVIFQWLNPKAWTMTMIAPSLAIITGSLLSIEFIDSKFGLNNWPILIMCMAINLVCISFWAAGGESLRKLISKPKTIKWVHKAVVVMVVYCAAALWL